MRRVLADLTIESQAATMAAMRLAGAYDRGEGEFARLATPIVKFWLTKRSPGHAAETLECLGGSGYVEDSGMPRLFRQSPLNGIWEGSGNVISLDVLRAMARHPAAVDAFLAELDEARGADTRYDTAVAALRDQMAAATEETARRVVERAAVLLEASLMLRYGAPDAADLFVAARVENPGFTYGALPLSAGAVGRVLDGAMAG
jgi:putative acyl-CoA dehydrogenase